MKARSAGTLLLMAAFFLISTAAIAPVFAQLSPAVPATVTAGTALWAGRTGEVLLQGLIILAGVFVILLLLGHDSTGGMHP